MTNLDEYGYMTRRSLRAHARWCASWKWYDNRGESVSTGCAGCPLARDAWKECCYTRWLRLPSRAEGGEGGGGMKGETE